MSIDQANHYILTHHPKTTGTSPLYHPPLTLNRSRFNPNLLRAPLQTRMQQSPNIHSSSPEPFSAGPISSLLSNIDTRRLREPKSSFLPTRHFRNNLEARLQEIVSPSALEPESSSSQPSEPVSGTCRDSSPFLAIGDKVSVVEDNGDMFSEELYRRINEFLDAEGLELGDPADHMQGIRMFSKARMLEEEDDGRQEQELYEIKGVQSANHSPKLIADNLFSSTLLQRRSCRSQGPKETIISLDTLEKPKGKLNVGIFRHFKDDLNQILQTASPIEEKLTPVISRNNSGFYENTPDRLGPKKFSFKHLKSPEPSEGKGVSRLAKYTIKSIKSFKSPHQPRINAMQSVSEISPLKSSKDTEGSSSLCSSPVMIIPSSSPGKEMQLENAVRSSRSNHGKVMRKSRFQTLRDLQE